MGRVFLADFTVALPSTFGALAYAWHYHGRQGRLMFKTAYIILHVRNDSPSAVAHTACTAGAVISTPFQ